MSANHSKQLDQVFMALADPTRRALVKALAEGEQTVSELAKPFSMSLAAVSKHLKVLEQAGLVGRRVDGRTHHLTLVPEALSGALDWIAVYRNFWNRRLDRLEQSLNEEKTS